MTRLGTIAAMLLAVSLIHPYDVLAQSKSLTDDELVAAIQAGSKNKNREQGLVLADTMSSFGALTSEGTTGFSVVLYTPTTWIRHNAALRAKRYQELKPADVDQDMRQPLLRVIANPDIPRKVTASGAVGSASVDHVVLQDKSRKITIQPVTTEPFTQDAKNALGATLTYQGVNATFNLDDLRELRGPKMDESFYVVVIGATGEEKKFEVKKKHFDDLP